MLSGVVVLNDGGSCRQHSNIATSFHVKMASTFGHQTQQTHTERRRTQDGAQTRSSGEAP